MIPDIEGKNTKNDEADTNENIIMDDIKVLMLEMVSFLTFTFLNINKILENRNIAAPNKGVPKIL